MQIRKRLSYQFIGIVAMIIILSSLAIYFFSANYRREEFYARLKNRANRTAKLYFEIEGINVQLLTKIDKDNPTSLPYQKVSIFNHRNEILYSTDKEKILKITDALLDKIRAEKEIRFLQGEYEILGFLLIDKYNKTVVIAAAIDNLGYTKLKNLRSILLIVFGFSITISLIAGWIYAGKALSPISDVIKQVENITISSLNLRVDEGNNDDEIAKLAITFNKMLKRLETAFIVQKNFIANASHELRTPLTSITGQIEVTLLKKRTNKEYLQTLISVLEDIKNLNSISNRLLIMAQASSENSDLSFSLLRIDEIIWQTKAKLLKRNINYKINVYFDQTINEDFIKLNTYGNEQLLNIAINNLMENGCKYSSNNQVDIDISSEYKLVKILFTNHGKGIDKNDMTHIFEPFYRGKNSISVTGNGIGLSLVKKIIDLHKGTITVDSEVNGKTTFAITLHN